MDAKKETEVSAITENTKIPLFIVVGATPLIIAFSFWLSSVDAKATAGAEAKDMLIEMKTDIAVIKEILQRQEQTKQQGR